MRRLHHYSTEAYHCFSAASKPCEEKKAEASSLQEFVALKEKKTKLASWSETSKKHLLSSWEPRTVGVTWRPAGSGGGAGWGAVPELEGT